MGDKGTGSCIGMLHPNYKTIDIRFIVPVDLTDKEVVDVLNECLYKYVKEHSKLGYKEPFYIDLSDEECA